MANVLLKAGLSPIPSERSERLEPLAMLLSDEIPTASFPLR